MTFFYNTEQWIEMKTFAFTLYLPHTIYVYIWITVRVSPPRLSDTHTSNFCIHSLPWTTGLYTSGDVFKKTWPIMPKNSMWKGDRMCSMAKEQRGRHF